MLSTETIVDVIRIVVGVIGIGMAGSLFSTGGGTSGKVLATLLALISIPLIVTGGAGFLVTEGTAPAAWVPLVGTVVTSTMTLFGLVAFLYAIRSAFGFAKPGDGRTTAAATQQIATAVVAFVVSVAILGTHFAAFRALIGF